MGIHYLLRAISAQDDQELFQILDEYDHMLESITSGTECPEPLVAVG